MEYTNSYYVTV